MTALGASRPAPVRYARAGAHSTAIPASGPGRDREGSLALSVAAAQPDLETRFATLVSTHRDRAVRLAWRLLGGDDAAAEDVAQEAFVSAYLGLARFRGQSSLETWFYRILMRKAYSHLRWRRVRERFGRVDPESSADPSPEPTRDPGLRRRIGRALDGLPRTQREAFVLVHLEGFTVVETAEIMHKAPGTVKSHLHRALKKLREQLEDTLDAAKVDPDAP